MPNNLSQEIPINTDQTLQFDEALHRYSVAGRVLPSVTQVINAVAPRGYTCGDFYLNRGRVMHKAIHLLIQGKLRWESVDEQIAGKIRAFQLFMSESGYKVQASELPLYSPSLRFAGTLDALMIPDDVHRILVDFKSSLEPQLRPQIGAYYRLCWEHDTPVNKGLGLWLREDGTYRCSWFKKPDLKRAQQIFINVLSTYNWMKADGLTE